MQSLVNVWIHLVWTTKNRIAFLHSKIKVSVCQHIMANGKAKGHHIDFINGVEDHLHCLIKLSSSVTLARLVNDLKGESSNWINKNQIVEGTFDWQDGYGAFSVSPSQLQRVRNYIKNQEKHHQKQSLQQEMDYFLQLSQEE